MKNSLLSAQFVSKKTSANLMQTAYKKIKESICSGEINEGDLIIEQQIATALEVSRTPVREALVVLEREGLVEIRRGVGIFIKPLTSQDIEHICEVRIPLETLAIKSALPFITDEDIKHLRNSFYELLVRYENKEIITAKEFVSIDMQLHELFIERCQNPYVQNFSNSINTNIRRFQLKSYAAMSSLKESTQQHLKLLEVLETRDIAELEKALTEHLIWSLNCLKVR